MQTHVRTHHSLPAGNDVRSATSCRGGAPPDPPSPEQLHIAYGTDPTTSMTIQWAVPLAGVDAALKSSASRLSDTNISHTAQSILAKPELQYRRLDDET